MYKECKTAQSTERQHSIAQSLCDMMVHQPYDEISVSSLCKKADIPRKSFYRYFDTKDDAFNYLIDKTLVECDEYSGGYRKAEMVLDVVALEKRFEYFKRQRNLIAAIARNQMSIATIQRISQTVIAQLREMGVALSLEYEMKVTMSASVLFAIIMSWHHSGYAASCNEMAITSYKLLTTPLIDPEEAAEKL